jgi:hypothetical protein
MASNKPDRDNPIGLPDPVNEPAPPKLDSAGKLGPTGERKQEDAGLKDKDGIWRDPASAPREQSK